MYLILLIYMTDGKHTYFLVDVYHHNLISIRFKKVTFVLYLPSHITVLIPYSINDVLSGQQDIFCAYPITSLGKKSG